MSRKSYRTPDHHLWEEVADSIRPAARRTRRIEAAPPAPEPARQPPPASPAPKPARPGPPPITGLDRRTERRLARGTVEIDARIDLHGTGLEMARVRLRHFVMQARVQGHRTVLVITGKGASPFGFHTLHGTGHFHAPERLGKLRRMVPEWLHEPEFREHVVGFQPAHPRHGGGGAFYVKIRRRTAR